ncbi:MAG TPA: thioredoxin family protein [Candidatus Binatia bacterium]|nr:thioredoxin family protein [Candidatus Binatia bacterium]
MIRSFFVYAVPVALLARFAGTAHAFTIELVATSQFAAQGAAVYRSLDPPEAFLLQPSPFGRPVLITTGPLGARLLDPARISHDAADPDVLRVDTSGPQEDFLSVRADGPNLVLDRDGLTMTLKEGPPVLGDRQLDELIQALPEYRRGAARYAPDPAALEKLRRTKQPTELLVFFGSWCPHCEQAVPRLVRVLEEIRGAPITVTFHGVPHDDWGDDPLTETLHIVGLPTAIVRRDGKEIARMEGEQWAAPEKSLAGLVATSAR